MDDVRGIGDDRDAAGDTDARAGDVDGPRLDIGADERRLHVRAYNHWVSLLRGRAYPSIDDLDPAETTDFAPNGVLLDFSAGVENPAISFVGGALREECAIDCSITHISHVPSRSLLSRLTDHYLQIIANAAPIGFEAEFVNARGHNTLYRGILMPFSSHGDSIDFIYGVINWKELVDDATQTALDRELSAAVRSGPAAGAALGWADGPSGVLDDDPLLPVAATGATIFDHLALARDSAEAVRIAEAEARDALFRTLHRAYALAAATNADPRGYEALLEDAGVRLHLRAPMVPVLELVFGRDYDQARLAEYAAVLAYSHRIGIAADGLRAFLEQAEGGLEGIACAERDARIDPA
ncbi:hypothetical protein PX554_00825 [Sphingomonas sp. H39-1-10]|uniref:hypothetical protein n=1 Tax=Sphingomonas TaxID=13687 RepID=UPI00089077D3|nr:MULTISPECIES: hypothetical protein [Sphingomonas]MDF0486658.1 hypothetical protein [Sphingomonas pollutisoli]SDA36827.1 hypothetical protein SAMN03159340_03931 [Sphingomonas sp. NFR15]